MKCTCDSSCTVIKLPCHRWQKLPHVWSLNMWCFFSAVMLSSFVVMVTTLQGPWVIYFIDIANTYPYLWALYAIALVLPFVLCTACCVRTKVGRCLKILTCHKNRGSEVACTVCNMLLVLHKHTKHTVNRHVSTQTCTCGYWCSPQIAFGSCLTVWKHYEIYRTGGTAGNSATQPAKWLPACVVHFLNY